MNNQEVITHQGERLSFFQLFSQKRLTVEIPIIQRDYAQGREKQSAVRTVFLDALHGYLLDGRPNRDLDFIYGSVMSSDDNEIQNTTEGRFIPLDGQQRLTTLFLLHWYLGQISGKAEFLRAHLSVNGRSLFTYETRSSSREFCDALMSNDINFNSLLTNSAGQGSIAATIQDAGWFYLSWGNDPTIAAMLTMLDAIHHKFSGYGEFFDSLVSEERPIITFLYLNLREFKLTDDLYIKMNARGKPLTHFENFKAQLEKKLKSFAAPWPEYRLGFRDYPVSGYDYFIHKIDTDWADIFWGYRNEATRDNTCDDELMNFVALVVANFHVLHEDSENDLFGIGGRLRRLSFAEYDKRGCLTQNHLIHLITMFDLLHRGGLREGRINPYLNVNRYYAEEEVFKKVIANTTSYAEKLRFNAFYHAVGEGLEDTELLSWMRVVFNLSENNIFNTLDDYHKALKALRDLFMTEQSVLEALKADCPVSGFLSSQVLEEKIKAHLVLKSDQWRDAILRAEAHSFFNGQIGCILNFSGVLAFYREHKNCDWNGEVDGQYFNRFIYYFESLAAVFTNIQHSSAAIDYAWERAVLSKGVYCTETPTRSKLNLLHSRDNRNNLPRDHSWGRRLRIGNKADEAKQEYVKAVLDDPHFSKEELKTSLEDICEKSLDCEPSEEGIREEWRTAFIKHPALYDYCKQGFIVHNSYETVLLSQSQRNHYHCELFTKVLELELTKQKDQIQPFTRLYCKEVKSSEEDAEVIIAGYVLNEQRYEIIIKKIKSGFSIFFKMVGFSDYPEELVDVLEQQGFSRVEASGSDGVYYQSEQPNVEQTKYKIFKLCSNLRS